MDYTNKALQKLKLKEPEADESTQRAVARKMGQLLESGKLDGDLENQSVDVEYLISRLEVREGDDNPSLKIKWNTWVGQMDYIHQGGYNRYQI